MNPIMNPIRTLVWECWRMSRQEIWLASCSALVLCLSFMSMRPNLDAEQQELAGFFLSTILATLSAISFAWTQGFNGQHAFTFSRHFTKPISTRVLVLTPLLTIVAKSFFTCLILLSLFGWLFGSNIASFSVSLGVAIVTGLLVCISWATSSLRWRAVLAFTIIGLAFLILIAYAKSLAESQSSSFLITWAVIKWSFYALGGIGFLTALPLVISGVAGQRNFAGARLVAKPAHEEGSAFLGAMRLSNQFRRPFSALVWLDLKSLGTRIIFWACIVYILFGIFAFTGSQLNAENGFSTFVSFLFSSIVLTLLLFSFFGSTVLLGTVPMPVFQTAKPVSDQEFAFTKLGAVLIYLALGFVIATFFVAAFVVLQFFMGHGFALSDIKRESEWLHDMGWQLGWRWSWLALVLYVIAAVNVGIVCFAWIALAHLWRWKMMLFLLIGLGLLAGVGWDSERDWQYPVLWPLLGIAYVSILAASIAWLDWNSVVGKRIGMLMTALISGFWLLGLVVLIVFTNIAVPGWSQRVSLAIILLVAIASWIPAGLAIALPGIFSRLRHQV